VIAFDTNILFPFVVSDHPHHAEVGDFIRGLDGRDDVALSELALVELYGLLRQPAVMRRVVDLRRATRAVPGGPGGEGVRDREPKRLRRPGLPASVQPASLRGRAVAENPTLPGAGTALLDSRAAPSRPRVFGEQHFVQQAAPQGGHDARRIHGRCLNPDLVKRGSA